MSEKHWALFGEDPRVGTCLLTSVPCSSGMSKRAGGGGNTTVTKDLFAGYLHKMIEEIKTSKPEVKAGKLDKRLRSYGHSKFCMFSLWFSRLLNAAQTPTLENVDIADSL